MGIGTNLLGYRHPEVDAAVAATVAAGNMSTLHAALPKPAKPLASSTSALGLTRSAPTARPSDLSRPSARNGPMRWPSRTLRNATTGCRVTYRSINGSGSTQPSAADHLSSGSTSCSADQRGETQHLANASRSRELRQPLRIPRTATNSRNHWG